MTQEEFFKRYTYSVSRDRIGGGGFGTVYKAYDNVLHREVAIKVSEVKTSADGKKTFSLKDEFEALNHVPKHPNIANYEEFYSFEDHRGQCDYAVMQYYPDGNLSNAIKQGLTVEQKEDIAIQLLEGIGFLHKHKVVHRDLKPGNILIVRHGGKVIPLITDFGLSKAAGVVDGSVFSNSYGAGTPKYSSPEQLQGQPLRFNTDLWSYGAILYEIFTGEQLFSAGSGAVNTVQADLEIYNKIVNGDVQSLGKMPEKWCKVAERCLVVDAVRRAKNADELFGMLKDDDQKTEIDSKGTEGKRVVVLPGGYNLLQRATEKVKVRASKLRQLSYPEAVALALLSANSFGDMRIIVAVQKDDFMDIAFIEYGDGTYDVRDTAFASPIGLGNVYSSFRSLHKVILQEQEENVNRLVLVTEGSKESEYKELMEKEFGLEVELMDNLLQLVKQGVSIYNGVLTGKVHDVLLLSVVSQAIGIEIEGGLMSPLVFADTNIPTRGTDDLQLDADKAWFVLDIWQGNNKVARNNANIVTLKLKNRCIEKGKKRDIRVCVDIDSDSTCRFVMKDIEYGEKIEYCL